MDDVIEICQKVIRQFDDIILTDINSKLENEIIEMMFVINDKNFSMWLTKDEDRDDMPWITVMDNINPYPHFMLREVELKGRKYNSICLYESEQLVFSLFSLEEKISFAINQLLRLISLTNVQIEEEYQKEFLYYWRHFADSKNRYDLYLIENNTYEWLELYSIDNNHKCIMHPDISINEYYKKKLKFKEKSEVLYLSINDARGILPPMKDKLWDVTNVLDIIDNKQIQRLSYDAYSVITNNCYSKKSILFVFRLNDLVFGCEIFFKNPGTAKLIDKIRHSTERIVLSNMKRCDYQYLNSQIGNDLTLLDKKIAIIGIGSLGSYIAREIIKTSIKNLVLVDDDVFIQENLMRHQLDYHCLNYSKVTMTKFDLCYYHPEILITSINKKIDADNIQEIITDDLDLVIFAIGNSDTQLICNSYLKKHDYKKPVLFCWLEGDGEHSHVLGVSYSYQGCFECLYTDSSGYMINNKLNSAQEIETRIIRNGCGGTRVAYGNSILLQTTTLVLSAVKHVFSDKFKNNFSFTLSNRNVIEEDDTFYERSCHCCHA